MKVALCISGQLRTFKRCFDSVLRNVIEPYNPDVFICTEDAEHYTGVIGTRKNDGTLQEAIELYKPKVVSQADYTTFNIDQNALCRNKVDSCNVNYYVDALIKMYFAGFFCKTYAKNENINYDVIIRSRFDLIIRGILPIVDQRIGITIPSGQDWLNGINDQIAWGDPESMFYYMDQIKYITEYCEKGNLVHPEKNLCLHLESKPINVYRVPLDYGIER